MRDIKMKEKAEPTLHTLELSLIHIYSMSYDKKHLDYSVVSFDFRCLTCPNSYCLRRLLCFPNLN